MSSSLETAAPPARNVVVITMDGFRWQEMFGGPAPEYFRKDSKGQPTTLEREYTAGNAVDRRTRLLPFMWKTMATSPASASRRIRDRMEASMEEDNGSRVTWLLVGAAIGAGVALLYAPKSGRDARKYIGRTAKDGREAMENSGREMMDKGKDLYERGRKIAEDASDLFERGKKLVQG